MYRNALIIVNPAANHGETGRRAAQMTDLFQESLDCTVVNTGRPGDARSAASKALDYDLVIAVGGDGTVHEVVNGLKESANEHSVLGILGTGSGNDYARTVGLSLSPGQAAAQILSGETRWLDLGVLNQTYFCNSLGLGFDARVAEEAARLKHTGNRTGLMLYFSALMKVLWRDYHCHRVGIRLDDGQLQECDLLCVAAMIGPTYGGGFRIAPRAVPDDGLLDVCMIDCLSRLQAQLRLPFVVVGRHEWMKPVSATRVSRLQVVSAEPLPAVVDGEVLRESEYRIAVEPRAIRVAVGPAAGPV